MKTNFVWLEISKKPSPDWAIALSKWHQFLSVEELVSRPASILPFRILFTDSRVTQADAHVIEPPASGTTFRLPYRKDELWAVLWALEHFALRGAVLSPDAQHIETLRRLGLAQNVTQEPTLVSDLTERIGERIYQHLFVHSGLDYLLGKREAEADKLRAEGVDDVRLWLELRFDKKAAGLARFPWELLRREEVFLLQTGHFELTRYHCMDEQEPGLQLNRPLSLLYIAPRTNADNLAYDLPRIKEAFHSSDLLHLREISPPSFERLMQQASGSNGQACHYDNHGTFRRRCSQCQELFDPWQSVCPTGHRLLDPEGYLEFDDGSGHVDLRAASELLLALYGSGVKLALVNACKASTQTALPVFGGMASALTRARIPAIVGMLTSVSDDAAGVFVEGFYRTLRAALHRQNLWGPVAARVLLQAVSEGRRQIISKARPPALRQCWWIPTLHLRFDKGDPL